MHSGALGFSRWLDSTPFPLAGQADASQGLEAFLSQRKARSWQGSCRCGFASVCGCRCLWEPKETDSWRALVVRGGRRWDSGGLRMAQACFWWPWGSFLSSPFSVLPGLLTRGRSKVCCSYGVRTLVREAAPGPHSGPGVATAGMWQVMDPCCGWGPHEWKSLEWCPRGVRGRPLGGTSLQVAASTSLPPDWSPQEGHVPATCRRAGPDACGVPGPVPLGCLQGRGRWASRPQGPYLVPRRASGALGLRT